MKPGSYCRPSSEQEWRAILDLADALGLGHKHTDPWRGNPLIGLDDRGKVCSCVRVTNDPRELSCKDFIAGMYALANNRGRVVHPIPQTMKPGSFCRPSSDGEWMAILDLALSLGLVKESLEPPFLPLGAIWFSAIHAVSILRPKDIHILNTTRHADELSCKDFIAGLYEQAEKQKVPVGDLGMGRRLAKTYPGKETFDFSFIAQHPEGKPLEIKGECSFMVGGEQVANTSELMAVAYASIIRAGISAALFAANFQMEPIEERELVRIVSKVLDLGPFKGN